MATAESYLVEARRDIRLAALMASQAEDDTAVDYLLSMLPPGELHLLEVAAERLSEAAYEKRQR